MSKNVIDIQEHSKDEVENKSLLSLLLEQDSDACKNAAKELNQLNYSAVKSRSFETSSTKDLVVYWRAAKTLGKFGDEKLLSNLWHMHESLPRTYLTETIKAIQNRCKFYNYEISQRPLPPNQPPTPQTLFDLRGAQISNLANTVHGNQQTHAPQKPQP